MSQDYVIKDIKKNDQWSNAFGTFQSYTLALNGVGEPVSMNKKTPVNQEPQIGDSIYGSLELQTAKNGRTFYRFKSEKKEEAPAQKQEQSDEYWNERNNAIRAQWAINQAREYIQHMLGDNAKLTEILDTAKLFYAMVEQVTADDTKFQEAVAKAFDVDGGINVEDVPI